MENIIQQWDKLTASHKLTVVFLIFMIILIGIVLVTDIRKSWKSKNSPTAIGEQKKNNPSLIITRGARKRKV